jgi:hypothetical protein
MQICCIWGFHTGTMKRRIFWDAVHSLVQQKSTNVLQEIVVCYLLLPGVLLASQPLKVKAVHSTKIQVNFYHTTRCYIQEYNILQCKSCLIFFVCLIFCFIAANLMKIGISRG